LKNATPGYLLDRRHDLVHGDSGIHLAGANSSNSGG
jgi:hypothetical protein